MGFACMGYHVVHSLMGMFTRLKATFGSKRKKNKKTDVKKKTINTVSNVLQSVPGAHRFDPLFLIRLCEMQCS